MPALEVGFGYKAYLGVETGIHGLDKAGFPDSRLSGEQAEPAAAELAQALYAFSCER